MGLGSAFLVSEQIMHFNLLVSGQIIQAFFLFERVIQEIDDTNKYFFPEEDII